MKSFKELKVWQKGIELVAMVYKITASFPEEEKYSNYSKSCGFYANYSHCTWFLRRVGDTNNYRA